MPTVFDGIAGVLTAVFGASGTITPPSGPAVTLSGILRENPDWQSDGDQRDHYVPVYTLQVKKPAPPELVRGATVSGFGHPSTFRVSGVFADRSPANDAFMVAHLEIIP